MKSRIPPKTVLPLSVASTLVVLALVLGYLSYAGRPSRSASQPRAGLGPSARYAGPALPPASTPTPATPGAAVPRGPAAAVRTPGLPQPAQALPGPTQSVPPRAGMPTQQVPSRTGAAQQSAPARSGLPLPAKPAATGTGGPAPATPASTGAATQGTAPEDAIVGSGPRGRGDPFSPLAITESQRPVPSSPSSSLPPPPGVGLPMPPGFGAPGTAAPPPAPGANMRVAGIMGSRARVAIIESGNKTYIVGVGERVDDAVVVSIQADKVVMRQKGVTFELGFGGERSS